MTLREAIAKLKEADAEKVTMTLAELASRSALTARGVDNLYIEHRLDENAWQSLISVLLLPTADAKSLAAAISKILRSWVLKGPEIRLGTVVTYGRAVSVDRFCALLVKQGHFARLKTARCRLRKLLSETLPRVAIQCARYELGQYLMWGTFSQANPSADPFSEMPTSADSIRALLGLERNEKGQLLLLLQYTLPEQMAAHYPTVAEAYAGEGWSYFFRPSPAGSISGMTLPWPEYQDQPTCPEVVHAVIRGERLVAPVRMLL